ncbi:MAG: hypothetical protein L6R43_16375, partial [Planctomycetes bacterium]|nr:hypothetical protein [Planctomycetota bacterium]
RAGAPGAKSPLPLLLSFGAAVALVVGGSVFFLLGGKGKEAPDGPGGTTASGPAPSAPLGAAPPDPGPPKAPERPKTPLEEKASLAGMTPPVYLEHLAKQAAASPRGARQGVEILRELKLEEEARRILEAGRKAYPHDAWLNEQLGLVDRTKDIQAAAGDESMMSLLEEFPPFQEIVKLREEIVRTSGAGWLDADGVRRLDGWLEECRKQREFLNDPVNARTNRLLVNLRYHDDFKSIPFTAVVRRPFTVFVETDPEPARVEAVTKSAERGAKALLGVYGPFLSFLRNDLGLAEAPRLEEQDDTRLRAFMFRSRKSFDAWHAAVGEKAPSASVVAYYSPVRQMMIMHADMDWATPSGVKDLPHDQSVCMHEGVHALYDWYQRWFCAKAGKPIPEGQWILTSTRSTPDMLFWVQEGLADYFAAARPVPGKDGAWEPGQPDRDHVAVLAGARAASRGWKVEEFLFADQGEIYGKAKEKGWGDADRLRALMYSHGWALTHFLLHGEGGKHRAAFLQYLKRDLQGGHFRTRLDDLRRDLPEFGKLLDLKENEELAYALKDRRDFAVAMVGIFQKVPQFARILRTRDLLAAFGLSDRSGDAVKKWMAALEEGYGRHCGELAKAMEGGK